MVSSGKRPKRQRDTSLDLPDISHFCSSDLDEVLYPERHRSEATQHQQRHDEILYQNPCDLFDVLPLEIVLEIFKHLDIESLSNAIQTCRRWRYVIQETECLWKWFCFHNYQFPEDVQRDLQEGYSWQAIFQRCSRHHAIRRKWENGEYSNINSSQAIPERSMTELTQDEWGKIFNLELVRGIED